MKPPLFKATLFFALLTTASFLTSCDCKESCCNGQTEEAPAATVEELGQMNRDFAAALNAGDAQAAANLYTEDASLLPPNENIVTGRENIKNYWQGFLDAGFVSASVKTLDAASDGDLGYEIGMFELQIMGTDSVIFTETGKYTEILERDSTGKWMSIYGMWSGMAPAAAE